MECKFQVGDKVVCVDARGRRRGAQWDDCDRISEGAVYEIAHIFVDHFGRICVDLVGRDRTPASADYGHHCGYAANRFRPIHETQIEELRQAAIKAAREAKAPRKSRAGQPMAPVGFMR